MIHAKLCCRSLTEQKEHKDISSKGGCRANGVPKLLEVFNLTQTLTSFFWGVPRSVVIFYGFYHMVNHHHLGQHVRTFFQAYNIDILLMEEM